MKTNKVCLMVALAGAVTIWAGGAQAASKVFDTFGPKYTSNPGSYYCDFGAGNGACGNGTTMLTHAFKFTPGVSGALSYIDLALFNFTGTQGATVTIVTDNAGAPGRAPALETIYVPKLTTCAPCSATKKQKIASKLHPALTAGTPYWLIVYPSAYDTGNFIQQSPSATGPEASSVDGGNHWDVLTSPLAAFDVFVQ